MMMHHWFFWLFASLYFLHFLVELALDLLNLKEMQQNKGEIPRLFEGVFSTQEYEKSIKYTQAKTHFGWIKGLFNVALLWAFIFTGTFHQFEMWIGHFLDQGTLPYQIAYPLVLGGVFYILNLPFGIYHQFILEEKFGFNRTKFGTFIFDQIKTMLISLALGVPLLALLFSTVHWLGELWWLGAWGAVMAFQLLTAALFPVLLAPIFYKFTPLPEGELKEKIWTLATKVKFKMAGVFTIDGSRRSSHSNAFFAGMGKARRIVLFDTLVEQLSTAEILSVLAHEMGHNVKKHIQKGLILSSLGTLIGFYALSLCLKWPPFFQTFGVPEPSLPVALVLFGLVSAVFTFPFNPFFKWFSRKNEYEADAFSVQTTGDRENMASSLIKLSKDNLSNLTPHPWYSFYHYSHTTTTERVRSIEAT